jgi:hypothetical protein
MSAWREKAMECAPELKRKFESSDLTPYTVFMELLPITRQAHIDKDHKQLQKIYDYAEWCYKQKEKKLWNAVGVSFYEHLCDYEETFSGFTNWVKKEIYFGIRDLLNHRFDDDKMKLLDDYYGWKLSKRKNHQL